MSAIAVAVPGDHITITTDPDTEPFWEAAKAGRLTACQCGDCGTFRMPPTPFCPKCRSKAKTWPELSGAGVVYSYAVCHRSPYPDVADFTYVPVVVDLDGAPGARLVSNLVDVDPETVEIGMKVKVAFNPIRDGWMLPIFTPA
ncbi:MAG: acyl dehydratase [Phenylobacterium sp.]|nr:acyl dehydratase [Phenylobacterium sp.]